MSPIFPIDLGAESGETTCPDRLVPEFDDTGLCGSRLAKVEFHRTAHPCRKDCIEMGFASCATTTPIDDCLCSDGITTAPGVLVTGGIIGWSDPVGQSLTDIAKLTGPVAGILGDPGAYYRLFAANSGTNLNCPIDEDDWDALLIAGATYAKDLVASPLSFSGGVCSGGVISLSLADLLIVDGAGPAGGHCLQTGGRRAFAIGVYDCNGKRLMFCPVPGIQPPPQCDRVPCCDWQILNFSVDSTSTVGGGEVAHVSADVTRPSDCECTPSATVVLNGHTYTIAPSDPPILHIEDDIAFSPGDTATLTLDWVYGGCGECHDGHDERTISL